MNARIVRILFAVAVVMISTVTVLSAQGRAKTIVRAPGVWMPPVTPAPCPAGPGYCVKYIMTSYVGPSPTDIDYTLAPSNIMCAVSFSQGIAYVADYNNQPLPSQWEPFGDAIIQPNVDLDHP